MKKWALILLAFPLVANAMMYMLVNQWVKNGQRFCEYKNGSVKNVGAGVCPVSIDE